MCILNSLNTLLHAHSLHVPRNRHDTTLREQGAGAGAAAEVWEEAAKPEERGRGRSCERPDSQKTQNNGNVLAFAQRL